MSPGIYLIGSDGSLIEMTEQPYDSEDVLQKLLEDYPDLLAGDHQLPGQARSRWMLVKREAGISSEEGGSARWSVDHVFLDQHGVPTLVEVKRSSDTRIRREVVGQMLDYAANAIVYWPADELQRAFEETCLTTGKDPELELERVSGTADDPEAFWSTVQANLRAGRIRMVFVADVIPPELKRIVEFLNEQMASAEILAVEIRQYLDSERSTRTLVPRMIGQTAVARETKSASAPSRTWDVDSCIEAIAAKHGSSVAVRVREVAERSAGIGFWIDFGRRQTASMFLKIDHGGDSYRAITLSTWSGGLGVSFDLLGSRPPFDDLDARREYASRLARVHGIEFAEEGLNKEKMFSLSLLEQPGAVDALIGALVWFRDTVKDAAGSA